jgi:hypothetical protein
LSGKDFIMSYASFSNRSLVILPANTLPGTPLTPHNFAKWLSIYLVRRVVRISSGVVFLLFLGAGLIQPIQARMQARQYRRRALRVTEPRVWFGADGIYHEAFGYTSLKELVKVGDHVKTRQAIRFTTEETTSSGSDEPGPTTYRLPTLFHVPSGYEEQASRLIQRYRAERLSD